MSKTIKSGCCGNACIEPPLGYTNLNQIDALLKGDDALIFPDGEEAPYPVYTHIPACVTERVIEKAAEHWADWLVDAVATATQNRMFLRGDPECDEVCCEVMKSNAKKAMKNAINDIRVTRNDKQPRQ